MIEDIVKRLRENITDEIINRERQEAADEIERLRADLIAERERADRLASNVQSWRHKSDDALTALKAAKTLIERLQSKTPMFFQYEHTVATLNTINKVLGDNND